MLDLLMPADAIDDCALAIAIFKQRADETFSEYAMRFRNVLKHYEGEVSRTENGRIRWSALNVALRQHGLKPAIQCLQLTEKPADSLKEAVNHARRHEAVNLTGAATLSSPASLARPLLCASSEMVALGRASPA